MPISNNRPEFQPGVGTFDSPNRQPLGAPSPPQFQPNVGFFGAPNRNPVDPTLGGSVPSRPKPGFCPTCGQRNQPSRPQPQTTVEQAPPSQPVAQNTGGRNIPAKSFSGSFGRF